VLKPALKIGPTSFAEGTSSTCDNLLNAIPEGSDGSGGTNGLTPAVFHQYSLAMVAATHDPLGTVVEGKVHLSDNLMGSSLVKDPKGRDVFAYALRCALTKGQTVEYTFADKLYSVVGEGILKETSNWPTAALDENKTNELLQCVLAHVNPKEEHVPIFMSGSAIASQHDKTCYKVNEAYWSVRVDPFRGSLRYDVWPLFTALNCEAKVTPESIQEALNRRVCGQEPGSCQLVAHENTDCTGEPGGPFQCKLPSLNPSDALPTVVSVIKTMLRNKDDLSSLWCPDPQ
jgi:hypothetical protein